MDRVLKLLEQTPWALLAIVALLLAIVPIGESHLLQKWRMLYSGTLRRPLDWFDLLLHTAPIALLAVKGFLALRST